MKKSKKKQLLRDGYDPAVVARDPWQFWQKGLDTEPRRYSGSVAAAEGGVDAYAQSVAQLAPGHWRRMPDGGKERVTTSALSRLMRNPNSYQTWSDMMNFLARQLVSHGNCFAAAIRNDRFEITQLHPIAVGNCHYYVEPETKELFYFVNAPDLVEGESRYVLPARDVLHIRLYTPHHPLQGVSPLTYAAMAMSASTALSGHMAQFFNNMARPSFILSTDENLKLDQIKQLRTAWEEQSTKMASGGVPILANGLKAQPLGLNSQDAQLVEAFKMTVEDIGRALRIPLPMLGVATTYASTEELLSFWLSSGLGFLVNHIEAAFDKFFGLPADEFVELDTDVLLRVDLKSRIEALVRGVQGGIYTINEARRVEDKPKVEGGDVPYLQQQMVPIGWHPETQAEETGTPVAAPAAEPAPEKEADAEITKALVIDLFQKKRLAA
jgi:HK97 family phage portal protein